MFDEAKKEKYAKIYDKLVNQIYDYLNQNNLKTMVLGISGGIDSTVVAALCNAVVEKSNGELSLYGCSLPTVTNEPDEMASGIAVIKAFCTLHTCTMQYIDNAVDAVIDLCKSVPAENTHLATGNIKARLRMIYLYHAAQLLKGIVMDTDNKTEKWLSFYTVHGDVGDLTPMADLWKHEVYELAEYIKEYVCVTDNQKHAIELSISLTPTDGNGVCTGGDMAQIAPGYTYKEVDIVLMNLYQLLNGGYRSSMAQTPEQKRECITQCCISNCSYIMDADTIRKVVDRHFNTEFKNNLPVRLHI